MIFALGIIAIGALVGGHVYGPQWLGSASLMVLGFGLGVIALVAFVDIAKTPKCVNGNSRWFPPDPTASLVTPALFGGLVAATQAALDFGWMPEEMNGDQWPGAILRFLAAGFLVHFLLNLKSRKPGRGS